MLIPFGNIAKFLQHFVKDKFKLPLGCSCRSGRSTLITVENFSEVVLLAKALKKVNSCSMIRSQVKAGLVSGPAFRSG
jgi:hypothetical protein